VQTKTKVKIVKSSVGDFAYQLTCNVITDKVIKSDPLEVQRAVEMVKKFSLKQEDKTKNDDGSTTYIYS